MKYEILLNPRLSTTGESISATASSMDYRYGYFMNYNTGQGGLTSQSNVQAFINDPSNFIIVDALCHKEPISRLESQKQF